MKSSLGLVANGLRTCIYQLPGWVNVGVLRESFDYPLYRYDRSSVFPCGFPCSHMHMDGRNVVLHDMGSDQRVCLILTSVQRVSLDLAVVQKEKSVADEFGEPVELRSRCSDGAIGPHNEKSEWLESEASERRISSRVAKRYDEASIKECSSDPSESVYEPRCSSFVEDCAWDDSCGLDSNRLTNRPDTNALPVNRSVSDRPGGWSGDRAGGGSNKDVPSEGPSGGGDGSDDGSGPSGSDDGGSDDGGSDDGGSNDGRSNDGGSDGSDRSDRSDSNGSNAPPDAGADRGESGGSGSGPSKDGGAGKPNNDPNRDESGKHNGNPGKRESDKRNGDPNGDESATSDKDQDGDGSNRSDNSSEGGPDNDKSEVGDRFDGGLGDKRGSALGGAGSENGGCGSETRDGEFDNGRRGEGGEGFGGRSKEVKEPRPAPIEQRTDGLSQDFRRNSRIASGRRNNRASVRSFADGRGFGYAAPHSALETRIDVRSIGNRQVKMIAYGSERTPLCLVNAHHNSHVRGSYRLDLQNKAPVQSEKLAKLQAVFLKPPDAGRNEPVNAARRSQAVVVHGRKSRLYRGASGNEEGSGSDAARHRYTTHFPDTGKTPGAGVPRGARGMQDGGKWGRSRNFGYSLVGPCAKGASRDLPGENDVRPVVGLSGAADARRLGGSGAASGAESCGFEQGPTGLDEVRLERELRDVEAGRLALAVEPSSTGSGAETDASVPVVSSEGGDGAGEREVGAASGGAFELVGAEGEGAAGVLGEGERYGEEDADAELGGGVERQESGADVEERSLFASVVEGEVAEMIRGLASGAGPEVKKEVESVLEDSGATGGGECRGERSRRERAAGRGAGWS
ncbi:hornerin-like [Schistocerca gregaria]|uniref:hornerin-like n=1 Tax=Schistocerca gregaria TaxID=7010 RepID=UPI00211E281D|nr:hornerin-like [Schistocerca gregaria]